MILKSGRLTEPPVPAGLKKLNASLQAFADFLEIDPHLIAAAAQASERAEPKPGPDLESALAKLTLEESNAHLLRILRGEPGAVLSLKKQLAELSATGRLLELPVNPHGRRFIQPGQKNRKRSEAQSGREAEQKELNVWKSLP